MVNHKYNFVDPNNHVLHSNAIESSWRYGKQKFKDMHGVDRRYIQSYLDEYMWRQNNNLTRIEAYTAILKAIGHYYSASSIPFETLNDDIEIQEVSSTNLI